MSYSRNDLLLVGGAGVGLGFALYAVFDTIRNLYAPPPHTIRSYRYRNLRRRKASSLSIHLDPYIHAETQVELAKLKVLEEIVRVLALVVPGWEDCTADEVEMERYGGAMTNIIFAIKKPRGKNADVLLRLYGEGTENFFDRNDEMRLFKLLSEQGIGVKLLGEFENGRVEKLIDGHTLTAKDFRDPETCQKVAQQFRRIHDARVKISQKPVLVPRIKDLIRIASRECIEKEFSHVDFKRVEKQFRLAISLLPAINSPVVFCHNDLQYGNVMRTRHGEIVFIDFEYGGYNYRGFDLGNYFCEHMYNYHSGVPHLPDVEFYPDAKKKADICRAYLNIGDGSEEPTEEDVRALANEADAFACFSELNWALWGYLQATQSTIDFDYMTYADKRLERFSELLPQLVAKYGSGAPARPSVA